MMDPPTADEDGRGGGLRRPNNNASTTTTTTSNSTAQEEEDEDEIIMLRRPESAPPPSPSRVAAGRRSSASSSSPSSSRVDEEEEDGSAVLVVTLPVGPMTSGVSFRGKPARVHRISDYDDRDHHHDMMGEIREGQVVTEVVIPDEITVTGNSIDAEVLTNLLETHAYREGRILKLVDHCGAMISSLTSSSSSMFATTTTTETTTIWRVTLPTGTLGVSFDGMRSARTSEILPNSPVRHKLIPHLRVRQVIIPNVGTFEDLNAFDMGSLLNHYGRIRDRVLILEQQESYMYFYDDDEDYDEFGDEKQPQNPLASSTFIGGSSLLTSSSLSSSLPTPLEEQQKGGRGGGGWRSKRGNELHRHTDPFAPREGKTLVWRNVDMVLAGTNKSSDPPRKILDKVWGEVPQRQTTAIMGPSGAGKTSLLNVLAGRSRSNGRLTVTSDVRLSNYAVDPTSMSVRKLIAFVAQDDSLPITSTPREAIRFSAKLRLPRSTKDTQLDKLCERMIFELGLTSCADTIVGGQLIKGISGGERKRTSVGVELVVKPALVFLDEPTSGLDSYSAIQLCQVLKKVANAGSSVLFTIHQPSSEIFQAFDSLILLNKGRVMYQGPVPGVNPYFEQRMQPIPPNYNPADWIMFVAQSIPLRALNDGGFFPRDTRDMGDAFVPEDGKDALGRSITTTLRRSSSADNNGGGGGSNNGALRSLDPPGFGTQVGMLFRREVTHFCRNTAALGARFGLTTFLAVLIGTIFLNVGTTDPTIPSHLQSHFGALIMVTIMSMFGTAQPSLLAFPEERPTFLREYSTNHYSVVAYFIARLSTEAFVTALQIFVMTMITYLMIGFQAEYGMFFVAIYSLAMSSTALAVLLGSSVEDPKHGQEMLPLLFVPQMLFAGFFVTPSLIPSWLRWARYLCALTYGVRILMVEEFWNCGDRGGVFGDEPDDAAAAATRNCNNLVGSIDAHPDDTWWYWLLLLALFVRFRTCALIVLRMKATKFF